MKILLITNFFPPINTVASHRLYSFAKYLPEFGVKIDVFTPKGNGTLEYDLKNINIIHPYEHISTINKFAQDKNIVKEFFRYTGVRPVLHYFNSRLYREGKKVITNEFMKRYDAVLMSFGPESVLRLGYYLYKKYSLPLIIDFRDLWIENLLENPSFLERVTATFLERRLVKPAPLVITVSKTLAQNLTDRYRLNVKVIYNGYFEDRKIDELKFERNDTSENIKLCYCGSLYNGIRPIDMIFPALVKNDKLHLHVAVFDDIDYIYVQKLKDKFKVSQQVFLYKNLTNDESLALQKSCDVLIFLNKLDGTWKGALTAKLFEYISARKFVLGIGHREDEAAEIIRELNIGRYTDSANEVIEIIEEAKKWAPNSTSNSKTPFFTRRNQAQILAAELKNVLG